MAYSSRRTSKSRSQTLGAVGGARERYTSLPHPLRSAGIVMPLADIIAVLETLRPVAKTLPVFSSQLEGAMEILITICKQADVRTEISNQGFF